MSVELFLYSKQNPSKREIEKVIGPLGFSESELTKPPFRRYFWFEARDLASIRGCHLTWCRVSDTRQWPGAGRDTKTVFITKTYLGRSFEDIEMQNRAISELRKVFGGTLYNDWTGTRGYVVSEVLRQSYAEKRCGFVLFDAMLSLERVRSLPDDPDATEASVQQTLGELGLKIVPRAVLVNNCTIPFLVAIFEDFLRRLFVAFVETQPGAQEAIYERQGKIEYSVLRELLEGRRTLAEHEAQNYSFQNIAAASAAYERFLGINLHHTWSVAYEHGGRTEVVKDVLAEAIELRHKIVHGGFVDDSLDQAATRRLIAFAERGIHLVEETLEKDKGLHIELQGYTGL